MKKLIALLLTLTVSVAFAKPEGGEGGPRKGPGGPGKGDPAKRAEMILKKLDTDESGDVSLEEFKAGPKAKDADPEMVEKRFKAIDKDESGALDLKELAHMGHRPGGPGKGKPGERPGKGGPEKGKGGPGKGK